MSQEYNKVVQEPEGYIKPWIVAVLTFFTLGIYGYVWIYKTTVLLNKKHPLVNQNTPTTELLLSIFVIPCLPIYMIIWAYKNGKRIDEYKNKIGLRQDDVATIGLVLMIVGTALIWFGIGVFCYIVAFALIQDKINKILLFEEGSDDDSYITRTTYESSPHQNSYIKENVQIKQNNLSNDIELLRQLKELYDEGIISEEEFKFKKSQLL